jgi:transcriptional regulator with XRE-family HTH domain
VASDQGPAVQSARLRNELVRLRKERGLTQHQVAEALEWSPSKLIRVEGGGSSITKVDLDALLTEYGITSGGERERLQILNRRARERGWWDRHRDLVSSGYLNYVGFEAGAAFIRQFQIGYMPGLLQTAEYAQAVTIIGPVDPGTVEGLAGLRIERQLELSRRSVPPRQCFLLDEGVIRRHVGIKTDRHIMPNQLRSAADRAERDEVVTLRIVPFDAGAYPGGLFGTFTLMEFEEGLSDVLFLDSDRGAFTMVTGDDPQVASYRDIFESILQSAMSAEESIDLIRRVADEMSS